MKRILILLILLPFIGKTQSTPTIKMSAFPAITSIASDYFVPVFKTGTNYKMNVTTFFNERLSTKTTSNLSEGSNQYFTIARARAAINQGVGLLYNQGSGLAAVDTAFLSAKYTTDLQLGPTMQYAGGYLDVKPGAFGNGTKKVLPDANYTVQPTDQVLILPNPAAQRTLSMPLASTMQRQTLTIVSAFDVTSEWVFSGAGYTTNGSVGASPFAANSNGIIGAGQTIRLESILDTDGVWKWWDVK